MTPEPEIVDAALRRIEHDSKHPTRKLAAKAVAEFRGRGQAIPWINEHDIYGAPLLDRDAVLHRSEPNHAPRVEVKQHRRWWWR